MRLPITLELLFTCVINISFAQIDSVRNFSRELSLTIDNDILIFNDWYYTAGHELVYRRLAKPDKIISQYFNQRQSSPSKVVIAYKYGNKIFTPQKTSTQLTKEMDRPYAGWNYGGISITRLKGLSTISHLEAQIGVVGQISGMGQVQRWWHKKVGYPEPRGWDAQIKNEVVLNINYQFLKCLKIANEVDLISTSGIYTGTGLNKLSQSFTLRLMNINSLTQSTWFNGRMAYEGKEDKEEVFIFINYGVDYIVSNIFLEGSLFDNPSPYTVNAETWVRTRSFGIMHSRNRSSFVFEVVNSSMEVAKGDRHGYARLSYTLRF